jgi:hypothetical protein
MTDKPTDANAEMPMFCPAETVSQLPGERPARRGDGGARMIMRFLLWSVRGSARSGAPIDDHRILDVQMPRACDPPDLTSAHGDKPVAD